MSRKVCEAHDLKDCLECFLCDCRTTLKSVEPYSEWLAKNEDGMLKVGDRFDTAYEKSEVKHDC